MRFLTFASVAVAAVAILLLASNNVTALAAMTGLQTETLSKGLVLQIKKKKHHDDNDNENSDDTKTVKLKRVPGSCTVIEKGTQGGMGCASPATSRCDKTEQGDKICCCYKIDDSNQ